MSRFDLALACSAVVLMLGCVVGYAARTLVRRARSRTSLPTFPAETSAGGRRTTVRLPPHCGQVRVEARYRAAGGAQASGDLYDVVRTAFGVRAIIGDVSGHGPKAADVAADILENFRELAQHEIGIAGIAFRLDGLLSHRSGPLAEWFVTAVIVQIPADSANVELVGCGHPPPLLLRPGRPPGMCELVPALPLGLQELDECWYSSTWVALSGGDALLFYTDGIVEARDKKGETYPFADRVAELVSADPTVLLDRLESDLLDHVRGEPHDDMALLFLQPEQASITESPHPIPLPGRIDADHPD